MPRIVLVAAAGHGTACRSLPSTGWPGSMHSGWHLHLLLTISQGEGIHTAMMGGKAAAETLLEARTAGNFSSAALKAYERRWMALYGEQTCGAHCMHCWQRCTALSRHACGLCDMGATRMARMSREWELRECMSRRMAVCLS